MTWFKVDDKFWSHRKTRRLTDAAVALWVKAGSFCGDHLTDGVVELDDIEFMGHDKATAEELVKAGLWKRHDQGYEFHDWHEYQPTKTKVETERKANRERVKQWRDGKKNDSSSLPVPSRPPYGVTSTVRNGVSNGVTKPLHTGPTPTPPPVADVLAALDAKVANG